MHGHRTFALVVAAIGMASAFLPWIKAPIIGSVSGMDGSDGWLVLAIFAVAALVALSGDRLQSMGVGQRLALALFGAGGAGVGLWKVSDVKDLQNQVGSDGGSLGQAMARAVQAGEGLWVMIIAGSILVLMTFVSPTPGVAAATTALPPAPRPGSALAQLGPVPACPTCAAPTLWVAEYSRFRCDGCRVYV